MAKVYDTSPFIEIFNDNETADAVSDAYTVDMYWMHSIQSKGAAAGNTFDVEISLNGSDFVKLGDTVVADGIKFLTDGAYRWLRIVRKTGNAKLSVWLFGQVKLER